MDFNLIKLVITVNTVNGASLVKWLHKSGSGLSAICKSNVCYRPVRSCESCSNRETCAWYLVFGQKLTVDPSELKRHQKPPFPFVFSFPAFAEPCEKSVLLDCGLVVIGHAIPYLEMLLDGFAELLSGDTCPLQAEVVRVGSCDYQGGVQTIGNGSCITRPEDLAVMSAYGLLQIHTRECSDLEIRLLSPLRLLENGRHLSRFDFSRFARSVMRRVSSMAYYYAECEFDCDFKALSIQVDQVICVEDHFCHNTGGIRKINGINGHGRFIGNFGGIMPFLLLGTYVHVGKGATFGMGQYEVAFDKTMIDT